MLDAGHNRDILDAVPPRPFQRRCRCPVFVLADANLLDDGVRNQDSGSQALDQIEPVDAGEQNER